MVCTDDECNNMNQNSFHYDINANTNCSNNSTMACTHTSIKYSFNATSNDEFNHDINDNNRNFVKNKNNSVTFMSKLSPMLIIVIP